MQTITVSDRDATTGVLAFDLRDLLAAMAADEMSSASEFLVQIVLPSDPEQIVRCDVEEVDYDPIMNDVSSIIQDICDCLATSNGVRFAITGFGREEWPTRVDTDLCQFLLQLSNMADALDDAGTSEATIDLFEQHLQCRLCFRPVAGRGYAVNCLCGLSTWEPNPAEVFVDAPILRRMLMRLVDDFVLAAKRACPSLIGHPWVAPWLESVRRLDHVSLDTVHR